MVTTRRSFVDEREDIQKKAFTKWINNQLVNANSSPTVTDLFQDLRDGIVLLRLLEILTGNEYKREIGKMRVHHIGNVNKVIAVLGEYGIKLLSISSNDIVDGNPKLTLALVWSIIQYWQGKDVLKSFVANPQQTNVEKFLLSWCQQQTKGYEGVAIKDFTTSWQDGLAFNALIHKFRPDLFDYEVILKNIATRNLEHAFTIAKNIFQIDRYLDVEDVLSEYPDKKSILMYVMCLFQQLPASQIVIEDKEKQGTATTMISMTTRNYSKKTKSPSPPVSVSKISPMTNSMVSPAIESRTLLQSSQLSEYQTNMERLVQWILKLEQQLDKEERVSVTDLKRVKEQFQKHEDFMISLTKDQNQIGQVLEDGNRLLSSTDIHLQSREENEVKEQMKILNRRWESLRSKALDRQSLLHRTLMKLQIDQIESFDSWLSQAEQNISKQLHAMEQDLHGVDQQYRYLAQLQDELVSQQQITESLQNMVIVIDDTANNGVDTPASKYTSMEIEAKLLDLSERWASICTFVQNRWIQLQEVKIELEQVEVNQEKVNRWLTRKEDEVAKILAETNINDTDILMQQVHAIKKTESEIEDNRQSILALDNSLKVLSTHYDSKTSSLLRNLNEIVNGFDKRWRVLLDNLEQCSARLRKTHLNIESTVKTNVKADGDTVEKTITTTVEETIIKKRKIEKEDGARLEYEAMARSFIDWIDSIERLLAEKEPGSSRLQERLQIVKEVRDKYVSYDDQFQNLVQSGLAITQQLKDNNEDFREHEAALSSLEQRWKNLSKQIVVYERDTEQFVAQAKFDDEFIALTNARNEFQTWIDSQQSSSSTVEMQVKTKTFQSYTERLNALRTVAERLDVRTLQRAEQLLRSWNETSTRLRELSNRETPMPQPTASLGSVTTSGRQASSSSVPLSPTHPRVNQQSSSSATTATPWGSAVPETGNLYTLTNIYTFADNGQSKSTPAFTLTPKTYRVDSYVEAFDSPTTPHPVGSAASIPDFLSSSSSTTRSTHTKTQKVFNFDPPRTQMLADANSSLANQRLTETVGTSVPQSPPAALPVSFTESQRKLRAWLEQVEQSLLNDEVRVLDLQAIDAKKKFYKDLLDQTLEQEQSTEHLNATAREFYPRLANDISRRLQEELSNYRDRLYDVKQFLSERLAKYNRVDKTLSGFERSVGEVKSWIANVKSRLNTSDASVGDARALENLLGRNQALQHEIREMQTTINRLNKDVVDLTQDADENLARHLREEMRQLNESWSHIISSTKVDSKKIQDALKHNQALHEEIQELEDWIMDKERDAPADDGPIFYQEQLRERLDQYQKLQAELNVKEKTVRNLVLEGRQDMSAQANGIPDLAQKLETLVSNWTNLQKKVDTKVAFYTDIYTLHEELKNLLHQENVWLDALQNKVFSSSNNGADAEEISEELDTLERFVKTHSKTGCEKMYEISDRLQATKVSIPATNSQTNQFRIRWDQLHDDALKKIHMLNSQISDYQHMGRQITAMFEWMKHTDNTLHARLKDDVFADDVPGEADELIIEFNQYEAFLRSIDDKIHALRSTGKTEAARRLEQQLMLLRTQFLQLQTKFRQFQKPSDFEPKFAKMRQVLNDIERNLHVLEIRSDDPDVIHSQLENCLKLYKTLSDIKAEVEFVIRTGRVVVEKKQVDEPAELTRLIDQLKTQYNTLGAKVSASRNHLDSIERHLRKFRKEYSHVHEWFVKADNEIRKIENKQVSKNIKEETDWIRATRTDIKKLEANFETIKNLERTIQKEVDRPLSTLHEKTVELKRQIDQLDRRLKDRAEIIEGQARKLEDEYQKFIQIYQEIIIRLDKLEALLSDAERIFDYTRITHVQDELRSVRTQLDELLSLGQELVSKSEKYSKLVGPDIETISRKFEELQRRIRTVQETQEKRSREQQQYTSTVTSTNNTQDAQRDDYRREIHTERKYNRVQRESRHRSPSESSDISTAHGVIDEEFKKKYLRCLAYMKLIERLYENHQESDEESETVKRRLSRRDQAFRERPECEEIEQIIRETEERAYFIEKTDVEQATRIREKIRRLRECLDNLKHRAQYHSGDETIRYNERYEEHIKTTDRTVPREREFDSDFIYDIDDTRSVISEPAPQFNAKYRKAVHSLERYRTEDQSRHVPTSEEYHLQPLLRVRSLKAIDHRTLSAPSSPVLQTRYRSHERSNAHHRKQSMNQQSHQESHQNSISKSASLPNGGFPVQAPAMAAHVPQQPVLYRERVIDRHVAERSTSRNESHRQQQQESAASMQARSAHASSGQSQTLNRAVPIRYDSYNGGGGGSSASSSYRQANGYRHEQYPSYSYHEQHGGSMGGSYRQPVYPTQPVGPHPTRIVN